MTTHRIAGPAGSLSVVTALGREDALPVVFVHGLAGNASHWEAQLHHVSPARRAVAVELRGHGGSERPRDGDYSLEALAKDVAAAAQELKRFVLVGHSIGGGVALACAAAHASRVAGLMLVDPMSDARSTPPKDKEAYLAALMSDDYARFIREDWLDMAGKVPAIREKLLKDLDATAKETVVAIQRSRLSFDPVTALSRYPRPKLSLVLPDNDTPRSFHRLGNGFPHQVVKDSGHWIQLERPEEVNRALDAFLKLCETKLKGG
ncbi:alpha/beta hydrolase [Pyxidicoccus parkwayensis]|uniref:Alpha/beta hydrolase n=1 Tax=Pyxidicoccus parkwayensis TaxID=2813578 RepID=A0ABX7P2X2_9BACT|nr:alpha/beta hydrolase [Pyxidicoccus parkwaysis]QSQ24812.1 alpha/beta hydrolase [Pyxidicoccus parkwaysis]